MLLLVYSLGKIAVSAVTSTELGYLSGVTSNIQTQLSSKADNFKNGVIRNIDLNTLRAGDYGYVVASGCTNVPTPSTNGYGILESFSDGYVCLQRWTDAVFPYCVYTRFKENNTWRDWMVVSGNLLRNMYSLNFMNTDGSYHKSIWNDNAYINLGDAGDIPIFLRSKVIFNLTDTTGPFPTSGYIGQLWLVKA